MAQTTLILSVEGNIGVGKSTMLNRIKKFLGNTINGRKIIFLQEPVDKWQSIKGKDGEDILTKFYSDQEKYAFPFQMMAYISRQAMLMDAVENNPGSVIISERCIHTDKNVFAYMLHNDGKIEDVNYAIYNMWFDTFSNKCKYNGHIYLRASPDVCHSRVKVRSRSGETIPLDYLVKCHDNHDNWLAQSKNTIMISVDEDMNTAEEKYEEICSKIREYIVSQL